MAYRLTTLFVAVAVFIFPSFELCLAEELPGFNRGYGCRDCKWVDVPCVLAEAEKYKPQNEAKAVVQESESENKCEIDKAAKEDVYILLYVAKRQEEEGKIAEAIETYKRILDISPDNEEASESYLRLRLRGVGNEMDSKDALEDTDQTLQDPIERRTGKGQNSRQRQGEPAIRLYQMEIAERIKHNWSYPVSFSNNGEIKEIEAIVGIQMRSNGTIIKSWLKKPSSIPDFDASVMKAIKKADPFPPFPEGYEKSDDQIEIRFNLSELESL